MTRDKIAFADGCALLRDALSGPLRQHVLDHILGTGEIAPALQRLRSAMRSHVFTTATTQLDLRRIVRTLDAKARQDGFHVRQEWEQARGRFNPDDVPVLMLDHFSRSGKAVVPARKALAVLLDFYLLYVLALLVMRVWDEGDPNENLDRITALLEDLQGPQGSGQTLVDGAAALLFVATSNYQPDDQAYDRLLAKVWTLDESHRLSLAMIGGPILGTHLRWAFTAIYERDLSHMRDDNFVDYPWLFFSVVTLMRAYARLRETGTGTDQRAAVVSALANGLSPDPWAFVGKPPDALAAYAAEHAEFRALFDRYRDDLLEELGAHIPNPLRYSPLSLQFNFPHNVLVAIVVIALGERTPANLSLNALLSSDGAGKSPGGPAEQLALSITGYAAENPELRGERRVLPVAYSPAVGLRSFSWMMSALRK